MPYEEAIAIEATFFGVDIKAKGLMFSEEFNFDNAEFPITIGRIMQALKKHICDYELFLGTDGKFWRVQMYTLGYGKTDLKIQWQLTKENGADCTDDDQTDETINLLIQLLT